MDAKDLLPGEEQWIQKYRAALDLPSAEQKTLSIQTVANHVLRIMKLPIRWLLGRRTKMRSHSTPATVIAPRPELVISKRDPNPSITKPSNKKTAEGTVAKGIASSKRKKTAKG